MMEMTLPNNINTKAAIIPVTAGITRYKDQGLSGYCQPEPAT